MILLQVPLHLITTRVARMSENNHYLQAGPYRSLTVPNSISNWPTKEHWEPKVTKQKTIHFHFITGIL